MNRDNQLPRDEIRELLEQAGPPPALPANDLAAIRAAARDEWHALQSGQDSRGFNYRPLLAMAASLLIALALAWWWTSNRPPGTVETVATVELVRDDAEAIWSHVSGDSVSSGTTLRTSTELVALRLVGGQSVRMDAGTEVSVFSSTRLQLRHGALYVDSGPALDSNVEIATALGLVTEIGTQFEVRVGNGDGDKVRVRVREGAVSLAHDGESYSASVGQQLTIDARGEVFRAIVPTRGEEWEWALEAAPGIDTEGISLLSYLEWLSRETGWEIQFADAALQERAGEITVHGSIQGQTPEESLSSVFLGSGGLGYEIRGYTLLVGGPVSP